MGILKWFSEAPLKYLIISFASTYYTTLSWAGGGSEPCDAALNAGLIGAVPQYDNVV